MKAVVILDVPEDYNFEENSKVLVQNGKCGSAVYGEIKPLKANKELQHMYDDELNNYFWNLLDIT